MEKSYSFADDDRKLLSRPGSSKKDAYICNVPVTFRDMQEAPKVNMRHIDNNLMIQPEENFSSPPGVKEENLFNGVKQ